MDDVKAKHVKDRGIVALANVCEILDSLDPHNRVHVMRYLISRYSACVTYEMEGSSCVETQQNGSTSGL